MLYNHTKFGESILSSQCNFICGDVPPIFSNTKFFVLKVFRTILNWYLVFPASVSNVQFISLGVIVIIPPPPPPGPGGPVAVVVNKDEVMFSLLAKSVAVIVRLYVA